jgi:hypothetical protein
MMYMGHDNNIDTFRNSIIFTNNLNTMSTIVEESTDASTPPCKNTPLSFEYNSNAEVTYVFYDTKYNTILREKLNIVVSRDVVAEFENDYDVIHVLFANEMLQILDISGIDDPADRSDAIASRFMEMFDMIDESPLSTCLELLTTRPSAVPFSFRDDIAVLSPCPSIDTPRHGVYPLLFSYDLLFFTHICLRDLFVDGKIKPLHLETLCDAIREYI